MIKTRSKQKNIRKDNRPDAVKAKVAERRALLGERGKGDWYSPRSRTEVLATPGELVMGEAQQRARQQARERAIARVQARAQRAHHDQETAVPTAKSHIPDHRLKHLLRVALIAMRRRVPRKLRAPCLS